MPGGIHNRRLGFSLLELLAAITLLVILGALLFQIFDQAAHVMRIGNGRQEIYQYARALFEALERELVGSIGQRDASRDVAMDPAIRVKPFRVYTSSSALALFGLPVRDGADALSLTSALIGRDTVEGSPTYGQTANTAQVAYWASPDDFVLNRYESYDLNTAGGGRGWEFAMNVLEFQLRCLDQYRSPMQFHRMDWESSADAWAGGPRRGMPYAMMITVKLTDKAHVRLYHLDSDSDEMVLNEGLTEDDDPMVQTFQQIVGTRETQ